MDHDRKFFDTFMLVLGALVAITIGLFFVANALADNSLDRDQLENPIAIAQLEQRLAPVGEVVTDAPAVDAPAAAPQAAPVVAAPAPVATPAPTAKVDGAAIYNQACVACHGAGIAGAPKVGDKAAWAPRLKQGMPLLYEHALKGYMGKGGMMPAKGGRMDLADDAVKAAVDHMAAASK